MQHIICNIFIYIYIQYYITYLKFAKTIDLKCSHILHCKLTRCYTPIQLGVGRTKRQRKDKFAPSP